jgi:hypothetical protein
MQQKVMSPIIAAAAAPAPPKIPILAPLESEFHLSAVVGWGVGLSVSANVELPLLLDVSICDEKKADMKFIQARKIKLTKEP